MMSFVMPRKVIRAFRYVNALYVPSCANFVLDGIFDACILTAHNEETNMAQTLAELIERWDSGEGKPYKGSLIDWTAYDPEKPDLGCMCAQGQLLHTVAGWSPEKLHNTEQQEADTETAKLLNISTAHAILLRNVNDKIDGAPAIVLTDPAKVLGGEWSKLLDFWWHLDQMTYEQWAAARAAAWDAAWAAAGGAAGGAAGAAARAAARAAANAASEIQGAHLLREQGKAFYFLPLFGFSDPEEIPARPADYGKAA